MTGPCAGIFPISLDVRKRVRTLWEGLGDKQEVTASEQAVWGLVQIPTVPARTETLDCLSKAVGTV